MARSIRWNTDDVRDLTALLSTPDGPISLRVRAEQHGTVWVAYIKSKDINYRSEHTSKDAAKQRIAKYLRTELNVKPKTP
jgi:DNA-directed RNA polymerase sigma subunit (sigma70/sigma32)